MRRRMLFSTLVVAIVAVLLLGLPLGALTYQQVNNANIDQLQREAEIIGTEVDTQLMREGRVDAAYFAKVYPQRHIQITPSGSSTVVTGGWEYDPHASDAPAALNATVVSAGGASISVWRDTRGVREEIISASYTLDQATQAMEDMASYRITKAVIYPHN